MRITELRATIKAVDPRARVSGTEGVWTIRAWNLDAVQRLLPSLGLKLTRPVEIEGSRAKWFSVLHVVEEPAAKSAKRLDVEIAEALAKEKR